MDLIESDFSIENRHPWETARLGIVTELLRKHKESKDLRILDVGSGDAFVAHQLTQNLPKTDAYCVDIEYDDRIIQQIKDSFPNEHLHLHCSLDEVSLKKGNVAAVTLLDVIEHVPDDVALLKSICDKAYISEDTFFFITVPAYQSLFSQHDVLLKHYRRYNLPRLRQTLADSGLEFVDGGYFFSSLIVPRVLQVLREKIKRKELHELPHLGKWGGGKFLSSLIKNTLLLDYRISRLFNALGIRLPGLSCYAICKPLPGTLPVKTPVTKRREVSLAVES